MAFTNPTETTLGEVRALIPDIVESDAIFDDATLGVYIRLAGNDSFRAAGLALGAAATDHARVESYRKTQGLTVDGKAAAALMLERSIWLCEQISADDEEGLFDIAEVNNDSFSQREILANQMLRDYFG